MAGVICRCGFPATVLLPNETRQAQPGQQGIFRQRCAPTKSPKNGCGYFPLPVRLQYGWPLHLKLPKLIDKIANAHRRPFSPSVPLLCRLAQRRELGVLICHGYSIKGLQCTARRPARVPDFAGAWASNMVILDHSFWDWHGASWRPRLVIRDWRCWRGVLVHGHPVGMSTVSWRGLQHIGRRCDEGMRSPRKKSWP